MKISTLTIVGMVSIALVACSESDTPSTMMDDVSINSLDANTYRANLQTALTQLRGAHFSGFIDAPDMANQFFEQRLPDATDYFGPTPFPIGSESSNCESGSVSRDITASDAEWLTINASYNFIDCLVEGQMYNGQADVELDGDTPSRLGGQSGAVTILINDMEIESGNSFEFSRSLNGSFKNRSGWGAAYIGYTREYTTESYREISAGVELSVSNASYIQKLESDYYPDDERYYRLTEAGSLTLSGTVEELEAGYSVSIDPTLLYSSKLDVDDRPVYDDDVVSGTVTYTSVSGGSVTVAPSDVDSSLVNYEINDGMQVFSETDEWLFPINCNDNSVMNMRNLCDGRR